MANGSTDSGTGQLSFEVPAAANLRHVRNRLTAWLHRAEVPERVVADAVMAVNEACTNSIEHGYRDVTPGPIRIEARLSLGPILSYMNARVIP